MGQEAIWDELVGDAWVRYAAQIDAQSEAFSAAALDQLGPLDGMRVLDVGCGTGATSQELARRGARAVVGVDLSTRMLAAARARTDEDTGRDTEQVSFLHGDVLTVDLDGPFDAVFSRFGVMFFDDATAAFERLRTRLRPGGRLAVATWQGPLENQWMSVPMLATIPLLGPPDFPEPGQPGPFSLDSAERLQQVLGDAGWSDVEVTPFSTTAPHPAGDAEAVAEMVVAIAPPLAERIRAHPELDGDVRAAIVESLHPHERDGGVVLGAAALVTTATA